MKHKNQFHYRTRRPDHLTLNYLDAGLVAGAAAFSSLAGTLFAGAASFLTTAAFAASALATSAALVAAGSAAKADTANADAIKVAISLFILFSFKVDFELIPVCNNYS